MDLLGPIKPIARSTAPDAAHRLKPTLSWPHLIALGVGAIVGTGIYTLTGVGAERAGPAVILAFAIAGAVCACAALAYAELATMIPAAGSAYTYTYSVMGETLAWIVGWSLILEYTLACSGVAVGWSGYLVGLIESAGVHPPHWLLTGPHDGGIINLPAVLVSMLIAGMLMAGTRESATLNIVLVVIKLVALAVFVIFVAPAFDPAHLHPFMPYGFGSAVQGGEKRGVMAAAAIVFFAFYGFDAVATSAEEARNPGRDLKIGIIGSMAASTTIYILVALTAVGALSYTMLAGSPEPLALVLRLLGHPVVSWLVAGAAAVVLGEVEARILAQRGHPRADRTLREAEGLEDRIHPRVQRGQLLKADLVNFLGRARRRRRRAQGPGVPLRPVRPRAEAGVGLGPRPLRFELGQL